MLWYPVNKKTKKTNKGANCFNMKSKGYPDNWDWEKKPKKVVKGTNKAGKHRKNIYNMLSDFDEEDEFDSDVDVTSQHYVKR